MNELADMLENAYLDYVRNYDTLAEFAGDYDLSPDVAEILVQAGRKVHDARQEW